MGTTVCLFPSRTCDFAIQSSTVSVGFQNSGDDPRRAAHVQESLTLRGGPNNSVKAMTVGISTSTKLGERERTKDAPCKPRKQFCCIRCTHPDSRASASDPKPQQLSDPGACILGDGVSSRYALPVRSDETGANKLWERACGVVKVSKAICPYAF